MASAAETPKPPDDPELRNIIDKLAQFVARNGSEFENMTKLKQKDNPRFSFLFGGDFFPYYVYKVNAEQAIMRKQKMQTDQGTSTQIQILQHQLRESEKNLRLQYDALMKQQQAEIDEAILAAERDQIETLAGQFGVKIKDFSSQLNNLQSSCSKEAIATNKNWCLANCQSTETSEIVLKFMINKLKDSSVSFAFKLHILYLLNDLIHNYMRKQNQPMMTLLGNYVSTAYFCVYVQHGTDESCREKLEKLKSIWITQHYFSEVIINKLSNVQAAYDEYRDTVNKNYPTVSGEIGDKIKNQYQQYEAQHQIYAKHVQQQITLLEMSLKAPASATCAFPRMQVPSLGQQPPKTPLFAQTPPAPQATPQGTPGVAGTPHRRSRFDTGPPQQPTPLMSIATNFPVSISGPQPPYASEQNIVATGQQQQAYGSRPPWPPQQLDQQQPPMHGSGPYAAGPYPGQPGAGPPFYPPPGYPPYQQPPPVSAAAAPGGPPQAPPKQPSSVGGGGPGVAAGGGGGPPSVQPLMSLNPRPPPFVQQQQQQQQQQAGMHPPYGPGGPMGGQGPGWRPGGPPMAPHHAGPMGMMGEQGMRPMQGQPLIPKVPYYDLPAALMVPLVKLTDDGYEPLDPNKIRLPPPMAPSERLLAAVEAFYSPANHENPRDSDGWERLGLYEFFKAKQDAIREKRDEEEAEEAKMKKSPKNRRRNRSGSYSSENSKHSDRSTSPRGRSGSRSRSVSGSPEPQRCPVNRFD